MKKFNFIKWVPSKLNHFQLKNFSSTASNFEEEFHKNHIDINLFQKSVLTAGSAIISLLNPYRGDTIACLGETTGTSAAKYILQKMKLSKEGSEILKERPRINSTTVNMNTLTNLPDGTLGKLYSDFLKKNGVTPDSRLPVQFVNDIELAYVIQRYREVHDLVHTILQMPTNMLGEVTVKWVEAIQTKLPMCIGGAIFGPVRLKTKHRQLYSQYYLPWALQTGTSAEFLLNIYFEKRWEQPVSEFYEEINVQPLKITNKKIA